MKPFPTILLLTALALLGYLMLPRLIIRWQPGPVTTTLSVQYAWPGASPQALERQVTAPLEAALALVSDLGEIRSVSEDGSGYISLELREGVDEDFVRFNVANQLRRLYPSLPPGVSYPTLARATADDPSSVARPVLTYALSGPDPPTELYRYATDQLSPQLSLQRGLARIEVTGGNRPHWRIRLNPARMAVTGLTVAEVRERLRQHFEREGLGFLTAGSNVVYTYREDSPTPVRALASDDWVDFDIATASGGVYPLPELAEIERLPLPPTSYHRINGRNSIRLLVYPTADANQLLLAKQLRTRVPALVDALPPGYVLQQEIDATEYLRAELFKTRKRTQLSMGILLLFVLIAYRSVRRLGVVVYALAVNLGLAFLLYWLLGVELNLYAFAGIAVSFGIMIDNVIIMLDALRRPNNGRVGAAITGATLTTLASLSVIFLLSAELRAQLFELARVMTINLGTSVVVALLLIPALVAGPNGNEREKSPRRPPSWYVSLIQGVVRFRKTTLLLTLLAFGLPLWWLPSRVEGWETYNRTIGSDYYRDVLRTPVNKWLGGSLRLFSYYVYEGSGYREIGETKLYLNVGLPDGATLKQLNEVMKLVENFLAGFGQQVERYTTHIYSGQRATVEITFPDSGSGGFPYALKNRLTAFATNFGGVSWDIYGVGQSFTNDVAGRGRRFQVQLRGYDQAGLDTHSQRLADLLLRHPRVKEVDTDANINWWERQRSEYLLDYTQVELARRDLTLGDLRSGLEWFDRNEQPDLYLPGGQPVALTTRDPEAYDRWRLEHWNVPLDSTTLPFAAVGNLRRRMAPQALHKVNQQYLRMVAFDYLGSPRFRPTPSISLSGYPYRRASPGLLPPSG